MRYTDKERFSRDQRYEIVLDSGDDYTKWSIGNGISAIVSGTQHISGSQSVMFHKTTANGAFMYRTLDSKEGFDLDPFSYEGQILTSVYLPDATDVDAVNLMLFSDYSNFTVFTISGSVFDNGWNNLKADCNDPRISYGNGVDWGHVRYFGVEIHYTSATVVSGIMFDGARANLPTSTVKFDPNIENITVSSVSLSTDAANTARSTSTLVMPTQLVDQTGSVPPAGDTNSNSPFYKLTDGSDDLDLVRADAAKAASTIVVPVQPIGDDGSILEGGSGGVGGGAAIYSVGQSDFSAAYTAATQLTLTGLPFTPVISQFIQVDAFDSSGNLVTYKPDKYAFAYNSSTGVLTVTGAAFDASGSFDVLVWGVPKAYASSENANIVLVANPTNTNFTSATLAAVTNGTDGSYTYFIDCEGYRYHGIQWILNEGSGTISGSLALTAQNDGTAPGSCAYSEVSPDYLGASFITASDYTIIDTPVPGKYLRVKIDASASNTADWTIYHVGLY